MIDFNDIIGKVIKPFFGYAIVAIFGILAGILISLNSTGESNAILIELGENKKISIYKPDIIEYDFNNLPEHKASALSAKLKKLEWDDTLSVQLRNLKDSGLGPFEQKEVEVFIRFTDTHMNVPNAGGYKGELMNQELAVYRLIEPENLRENFAYTTFQVLIEDSTPSAKFDIDGHRTIWINRNYACEWLGIEDERNLPDRLVVKARIIRSVRTFTSDLALASYLSDVAIY
jgi:hypothetical protein